MNRLKKKLHRRSRIKKSIRSKIAGTAERPRLTVFRSNKEIYAQIINDVEGKTLAAASTLDTELKTVDGSPVVKSQEVGKAIAQKAVAANITDVVFDRNGYLYHGRVKALADSAREAGLKF